jgi:hypothetical protein
MRCIASAHVTPWRRPSAQVVELASLHDEMHRFPTRGRTAGRTVGTAPAPHTDHQSGPAAGSVVGNVAPPGGLLGNQQFIRRAPAGCLASIPVHQTVRAGWAIPPISVVAGAPAK